MLVLPGGVGVKDPGGLSVLVVEDVVKSDDTTELPGGVLVSVLPGGVSVLPGGAVVFVDSGGTSVLPD